MSARIAAIDYYLPENVLSNELLSREFPEWSVEKISAKTGIHNRHIAGDEEFASDLAASAAKRLFAQLEIRPDEIDYLLVCTQSPDYLLPSTACVVHEAINLRKDAGSSDINLGCSGFVYALGQAKGLIESGQVSNVLILTTDTYSKFVNRSDKSVRTIFGDGAAAALITDDGAAGQLDAFVYGTDGSGARHLIVPKGGLRDGTGLAPNADAESRGLESNGYDLYMDGPEIFNFTIRTVPESVDAILGKASMVIEDIDLFVFHQANAFMLDHLRRKLKLPREKFFVSLQESGNTVSSTIPIALRDAEMQGVLQRGQRVLLLGFGVGLSWGGLVMTW